MWRFRWCFWQDPMPFSSFWLGRRRRLMNLLFSIYKTAGYCLNDCFASCENVVWISFKRMYGKLLPPPTYHLYLNVIQTSIIRALISWPFNIHIEEASVLQAVTVLVAFASKKQIVVTKIIAKVANLMNVLSVKWCGFTSGFSLKFRSRQKKKVW